VIWCRDRDGTVLSGRIVFWGAIAIGLLLAASACGDDQTATTVRLLVPDDGSAPAYGEAPFPSDAWRSEDGHLEPPAGLDAIFHRDPELIAAHLATLDGFGVRPLVEFPIDGALDPATVDGAARVVDVDPDSPELGREVPYEWRWDPDRQVLAGSPQPGQVLRAGTRYAALLGRGLRDTGGVPLARSADLVRLAADQGVPARWRTTADAITDDVVGLAVFTTERATRTMAAARALLDDPAAVPTPELSFPDDAIIFKGQAELDRLLGQAKRFDDGPRAGSEHWGLSSGANPTGVAHDHVGVIATGMMTVARFRRADTGDDGPDDETFDIDPATGAPALASMDSIPVTFMLPAAPPSSPAGYPVVIIAHGLGSSRHAILTFAEPLARAGIAAVAIDADTHGSRRDPTDRENNLSPFLSQFAGEREMADGFGDHTGLVTTFDFLEGLRNLSGARDAIRQSVLDFAQLGILLRRGDLDLAPLARGGVTPVLDTSHIAYLGESFGTIVGGVLAGVEPDIDLYVLDVAGAGMLDLAMCNAPGLATVVLPLAQVIFGVDGRMDRFHPAVAMLQWIMDPADPLTYAPHLLRDRLEENGAALGPRSIVVLEVVGDEVIHNVATESLARAAGLEVLPPGEAPGLATASDPSAGNVDGQTAVIVQIPGATHGANWTSEEGRIDFVPGFPHPGDDPFPRLEQPISVVNPIYSTLEQVIEIVATHQAGDAPLVRSARP
jgi:hypothetical protein